MLLCAGLISLASYISLSRFRPLLLFTVAYCIIVSLLCIGMSTLTFLWWIDLPGVILGYAIISTYGVLLAVDVVPIVRFLFSIKFEICSVASSYLTGTNFIRLIFFFCHQLRLQVMYVVFALRFHRLHAVETVQISFKELDKKKALRNRARRYSPRWSGTIILPILSSYHRCQNQDWEPAFDELSRNCSFFSRLQAVSFPTF